MWIGEVLGASALLDRFKLTSSLINSMIWSRVLKISQLPFSSGYH